MSVVVVGRGSMIGQVLARHPATRAWLFLGHEEALARPGWEHEARCVLNLAFHPGLRTGAYDPALDMDGHLARRLAGGTGHLVMLSSRMAYGPAPASGELREAMAPRPDNAYGRSKLQCERAAAAVLGDRLTVLRLSNIFDSSEAQGGRRSFFGMALQALARDGRIRFDMSPLVRRDFLPADRLASYLVAVAARPKPGLFNLGAGFPVETGRIAAWLAEGHGGGELLVTDLRERDAFWLDMTRSRAAWGLEPFTPDDLRDACRRAGAGLRDRLVA